MSNESPAAVIVDVSGSNIAKVNSAGKLEINTAFSSSLPSGSNPLGQVGIKIGESGDLSLEATQLNVSSSLTTLKNTVALDATLQNVSSSISVIRDTVSLEATQQQLSSSLLSLRNTVALETTQLNNSSSLSSINSRISSISSSVAKETTQLNNSSSLATIRDTVSLESTQLNVSSSLLTIKTDLASLSSSASKENTQLNISSSLQTLRNTVSLESTQLNVSSSLVNLISLVSKEATLAAVSSSLHFIRNEMATQVTLLAVSGVLEAIRNTSGVKKITDELPSGSQAIGTIRIGSPDGLHVVDVLHDDADGFDRLRIEGKVSITAPTAPSGTNAVIIASSGSLSITSTIDDHYLLTSGTTFTLQQIVGGSEGDSTAKGSVVEVFYGTASVNNIVDRVYVNGFSTQITPDTNSTRTGQLMTGSNKGERIILRRRRLSGANQEVDAIIRGYESDS